MSDKLPTSALSKSCTRLKMSDENHTIEDRDREFARQFLRFGGIDPNSNWGAAGVEILCRALMQARKESDNV